LQAVGVGIYVDRMLREANNAAFVQSGWLLRRCQLRIGRKLAPARISRREHDRQAAQQLTEPVPVLDEGTRRYWWFHDRVWWEDAGLGAGDVRALVLDRERRARRRLERAHALMHTDAEPPVAARGGISQGIKRAVWERCAGRCVECDSDALLEFDHIIPLAMGGANTERNLQLLCADCNRAKGDGL
jgi:hypothetical protein